MKVRIFLIPFSIAFSNSKILDFLFLRKMAKLSSERRKPSGNRREFIREASKLYMNGTVI